MNDLGTLSGTAKHVVILDDETLILALNYEELGPNARKVARALLERLVKGREHGDFDKPHDWDKESSEEALDLAVYQAAKLLGLGGCAQCTARGHGYPCRFADCSECGEPKPEEPKYKPSEEFKKALRDVTIGVGGHEFVNGKKYTRFHDGTLWTLVDEDGRTLDGKPWVPPAGARVRVVFRDSCFNRFQPNVGYVGVVLSAEQYSGDSISISFANYGAKLCRVVPA